MSKKQKTMTNDIVSFFHCRSCIEQRPDNMSPRQWVHIEMGWTKKGLQAWCVRCNKSVVNLDFDGQKVTLLG